MLLCLAIDRKCVFSPKKVNYMFEPFHIEYYDSTKNTNRYAFPDFYLPDTNEIIELKSTYTIEGKIQEMKDKFKAYEELGYKTKLLLDWEFVDIDKLEESFIEERRSYGSQLEKNAAEILSELTGGKYESLSISKS